MKGNTNAAQSITVDNVLSTTSTNPVQNKVVAAAVNSNSADITSLEGTVSGKADKANTLSGYGITDAYTKEEINTRLDQNVQRDTTATANSSTVNLNITKGNVNAKSSSTSAVALPVANATQAGVMNPATFQAIQDNAEAIDAILDGTISISTLPSNPSQGDLTNAWKNTTGKDTVINGAKIDDSANETVWTYYTNITSWKGVPYSEPSVQVSQWTNSAAGIVKGSTEDGQVFAESDGTGSVNGWDELKSQVANNESNIASNTSAISANTQSIATNTQNIATNTSDIASLETAVAGTRGVFEIPIAFDMLYDPDYHPTVDYEGLRAAVLDGKDILIVDTGGSKQYASASCVIGDVLGSATGYITLSFQTSSRLWRLAVLDTAPTEVRYLTITSDNLASGAVKSGNIDWVTINGQTLSDLMAGITKTTYWIGPYECEAKLERIGNLVIYDMMATPSSLPSNGQSQEKIPVGYRPVDYTHCVLRSSFNQAGLWQINPSGTVSWWAGQANPSDIQAHCIYRTNDAYPS